MALAGHGGSTPDPLYYDWLPPYNKTHPQAQVYYVQMGAVESLKNIRAGIGDFGGGEFPLSDREMSGPPRLVNLPIAALALVPIYNIPEFSADLRLSGPVLANISLGIITHWSDPAIQALNPQAKLPDVKITFVHRGPGKAMNHVLTEYLSKVSRKFKATIGRSHSPKWPIGVVANRQEDIARLVRKTPNSIGYGEIKEPVTKPLPYNPLAVEGEVEEPSLWPQRLAFPSPSRSTRL